MRYLAAILAALLAVGPAGAQTVTPAQNTIGYHAIYQAYPSTALTGTTSETNLAAIRIPANSLGPNGLIRIWAMVSYTNSANNKTLGLRFNASSGAVSGNLVGSFVGTTTVLAQVLWIIRAAGATNAQATFPATPPFGTNAAAPNATAVDTTADSFVNINGTLALGTETMTLLSYTVELLHP